MSFIAGTASRLSKRFPTPVTIYKVLSRTPNLETGTESITVRKLTLPKALFFPPQQSYQLTQFPQGQFNFGGQLPSDASSILFPGSAIPADFIFDIEDCHVVINHIRYELVKFIEYPNREAFILFVKAIIGSDPEEVQDWTELLELSEAYERELA